MTRTSCGVVMGLHFVSHFGWEVVGVAVHPPRPPCRGCKRLPLQTVPGKAAGSASAINTPLVRVRGDEGGGAPRRRRLAAAAAGRRRRSHQTAAAGGSPPRGGGGGRHFTGLLLTHQHHWPRPATNDFHAFLIVEYRRCSQRVKFIYRKDLERREPEEVHATVVLKMCYLSMYRPGAPWGTEDQKRDNKKKEEQGAQRCRRKAEGFRNPLPAAHI